MNYPWFRFYDEVLDDPKVQRLPGNLFKVWVNFMCLANKHDHTGGTLPPIDDIAFKMRMTRQRAEAQLLELVTVGLFEWDNGIARAHNWSGRQFHSDVSTDRVKRFRERLRNVTGVSAETVPPAVIDTDTEQIQNRSEEIIPRKRGKTDPPKEFEITEEMREWANSAGFTNTDITYQTAKMLDHFRGNGERKSDWIATWRNWLRNSKNFDRSKHDEPRRESAAERAERLNQQRRSAAV